MIFYPWLLKQGLHLYKDISIAYPPLSIYFNYLFFSLFGFTVINYRILTYSIIILNDILLFALGNWLWKEKKYLYFIMSVFIVLQVSFEGNLLWHELMYVPLMLITYWLLCRYVLQKSINNLIFAGILFGITFLIKQTIFWSILTISITIFLFHIGNIKTAIFRSFIFGIIPIALFIITGIYYFFQNSLGQFIYWIILYPLSLTHLSSYLYLPSWKLIVQIFSIYIFIPLLIIPITSKKTTFSNRWFMIFCFSFCLGLTPLIFPRWNIFRLQPSLIFIFIAFGFILSNLNLFYNKAWHKIFIFLVGVIIFLLITHYIFAFFTINNSNVAEFLGNKSIKKANKINAIVKHNSFYIWGDYDYYYFLMNRTPYILPWTHHFPWMIETANLASTIIKQLEEHHISYIIYTDTTSPTSIKRYLNSKYELYEKVEDISVFKLRN
jgi:hypothetical protein